MGDTLALLGALYGTTATTRSYSAYDALSALTRAEQNKTREVAAEAKQPQVARDVAAFTAAVKAAKDPATLLANPTVLKVLLTANGLGSQSSYTALATRALLSDTTDPKSLANTLPDTRWKTIAKTFDFAKKGLSVIQDAKSLATIADGYAEVKWRQSLDVVTPGLSNALSFRDQAASITSADQILGDGTLRTVVTTALGIPPQIAFQSLPTQEKAITDRLDITRFQDPKYVDSFARRYLVEAQTAASSAGTAPSLEQLATSLVA